MKNNLNKLILMVDVTNTQPTVLTGLPTWAFYVFGSMWFILGILLLLLTPLNNKKVLEYKQKQLKLYKEQRQIKHNISYEEAKIVLPFGQKVKQMYAPILGITFIGIGIFWIIGRTAF